LLAVLLAFLIAVLVVPRLGLGDQAVATAAAGHRGSAPRPPDPAPSQAAIAPSLAQAAAPAVNVDQDQPTPAQRRCQSAFNDVLIRRLHSDELRDDPRHAAGGVLLGEHLSFVRAFSTGIQPRPVDTRLLAQAVARSPDDVLLAWLYAHSCTAPDCDSHQAWANVLALEPGNLAAWLLAPYDKTKPPSKAETDAWLAQSARATYVDGHFGDFAQAMAQAIGTLPALPVCKEAVAQMEAGTGRQPRLQDLVTVTAHAHSMIFLPAMRRLNDACPREKPITHRRHALCQQVMRTLAASNDMVHANMSTPWLVQRAPTAAERARWAEHKRNLRWAMESGAFNLRVEHLPLVWEQGELAVVIAILESRGQWPAPPGWQPPQPY
jgi:hypothetical protein